VRLRGNAWLGAGERAWQDLRLLCPLRHTHPGIAAGPGRQPRRGGAGRRPGDQILLESAPHLPEPFTEGDYLNGRWIARPVCIFDCDPPVNAAGAYLFTTADRARDLKQQPVYVLDHTEHYQAPQGSIETLEETEEFSENMVKKVYRG
jgi:hypothetical protein